MTFAKADKSNTTVIISTDDLNKVQNFMEQNNITELKQKLVFKFVSKHLQNVENELTKNSVR